jgi:hypothetical protein
MVSRGIDYQLQWHKNNQGFIFGGSYHGEAQENDNGPDGVIENENDQNDQNDPNFEEGEVSRKSFLAQSFHGGRRHLRKLASNALVIASELEAPTVFITLTCNQTWPEIQEALLPGQTAFDRPDVVCRVFKARLEAFLNNLNEGKYFDTLDENGDVLIRREVVYMMYSIEYQNRGLPHAHIIVKLRYAPDLSDPAACSRFVDEFLTCEMPVVDEMSSEDDIRYHKIVDKNLVHNCVRNAVNGCLDENGICTKGFMHTCVLEHTEFDGKGHAKYKRLKEADLRVVPHSRQAVLDYDGHMYWDWCANAYTVMYLYKYIFKGSKKVKMRLDNADDVDDEDEITLYIRGRYLCSMDAMWRSLGYQTYPSSKPAVRTIKAILPKASENFRKKSKLTDLELYFCRPELLWHLKYTDFNREYIGYYEISAIRALDLNSYYILNIQGLNRPLYLCKRSESHPTLVRMEMLYPQAGEVWYLRQLLLHKAFRSFEDVRTFDNIVYNTFQLSALMHGLVIEDKEANICFADAIVAMMTPLELRFLFATLTLEGFPTHGIFYDDFCFAAMTEDYTYNSGIIQSRESIFNTLLVDLTELFADRGSELSAYGFPEPIEYITALEREQLKYSDTKQQDQLLQTLQTAAPNNTEQEEVYQAITTAIDDNGSTARFFIQGQGGCGKTTLAKKLMAYARSKGHVALGCASTALAATNYDDFTTAHSLFCFPVIEDGDNDVSEPPSCNFMTNPQKLELIMAARVLIWDEMPCNHKQLYESAYRATNGFKGKILICMGDWRQIMPIIKYGTREEIVEACIKSSYLWHEFVVLTLTINMRLQRLHSELMALLHEKGPRYVNTEEYKEKQVALDHQISYGKMILAIGEGRFDHDDLDILNDNKYDASQIYRLPTLPYYLEDPDSMKKALDWLYPNGFDSNAMTNSCILAARNDKGDMWNKMVQDMNPNEAVEYKSRDKLCEVDDPHGHLARMMTTEVLNNFNNNGIPPHTLTLKVGDVCLVMRNLSKTHGLVTNKRVRILKLMPHCIKVQTMDPIPKVTIIPRLRFKFRLPLGESFQVMRTQFPLRLAYCMSYNKSQGQTLERVLLDITTPPFAHGHLYVALSRVTLYSDIRLICTDEQLFDDAPIATNTTYPELLT